MPDKIYLMSDAEIKALEILTGEKIKLNPDILKLMGRER